MAKLFCIFHAYCDDGFGAAWAVRHALGNDAVDFYPGVYGKPPPDVTGRDVLMVDFSYKYAVIEELRKTARSILILDHHKTAEADLEPYGTVNKTDGSAYPYADWVAFVNEVEQVNQGGIRGAAPIACLFDVNRSGAGIAWDFFHPGAIRPRTIDYLEDRDLWKKVLPHGDEFTICLRSYPQEFPLWDEFVARFDTDPQKVFADAVPIQRYYRRRVEEIKRDAYVTSMVIITKVEGDVILEKTLFKCAIANAPYFAASEVAGELCDVPGVDFGACFFERADGLWQYSLRSRGDFDVSVIALSFGGGGHKNAAGFQVAQPVHYRGD